MARTIERYRNAFWAVLLASTVLAFAFFATRAQASKLPEGDTTAGPSGLGPLIPVPMSVEPTGAPPKPPYAFVSMFGTSGPRTYLSSREEGAIVARARLEIERVAVYDNSWMQTSSYPMGDVPANRGACTDVVVRSLREIGIDLQELVHDDIVHDMRAYGVSFVDDDIDHRRVSTLYTFFTRNALSLTTDLRKKSAWRPGDIVFVAWQWTRGAPPEHVAVVSDRIGPRGLPLVIENGGPRPVESDSLGKGRILGHFRALKKR
jgi:uncharacterized protein YijF (DUF1287 family)